MDQLTLAAMRGLARSANADTLYFDAVGVVEKSLARLTSALPDREVLMQNKADQVYPIVAWASIAAKVERDRQMLSLEQEHPGIGTGYNTPQTMRFLEDWSKRNASWPPFVRTKWKNVPPLSLDGAIECGPECP